MTRGQEAYNSMGHKTIEEMKRHNEIWKDNKDISETVGKAKIIFEKIDETLIKQNLPTEGATMMKNKARKLVNTTTNVFLGCNRSYAKKIGDDVLYENSNLTMSEIRKIKDTEINALVKRLIAYASKNLKELASFGMTEKMIEDYGKEADGFINYLAVPQAILAERKTATKNLKKLFKQLDELFIGFLDNYMMQYIKTEPDFYSDYEHARIIYDDPTISRSLMGTVIDEETNEPLQYVLVTVICESGKTFTYKTSEKGNFLFKKLPEGKCKVTFNKNYYDILTVNSEIHNNAMTRLNVAIRKTE